MKKVRIFFYVLSFIAISVGLFVGYSKTQNVNQNQVNEQNKPKSLQSETKTDFIYATKTKDTADRRTLLDDSSIDIDQDGQEESVELYTAAEKDSKGEIAWDDGQPWLLRVTDGENEYILFDDYVQLGDLNYWLYTTAENEVHITTMQTSSAGFLITDYKFDNEKKRFERNIVFNPKSNILVDHSRY